MIKGGRRVSLTNSNGSPLIAVPSNVGPRTMPNYDALAAQGVYSLQGGNTRDIRVFVGTVADPFFIDLGATFDSLNFRPAAGGGVLSPAQDANDQLNSAPNSVAGFNVNTIAIEIPIELLTSDGAIHGATNPKAVIGAWATTSRQEITIRRSPSPEKNLGGLAQIQRLGNPLINELVIGTGSKDYWSMSDPVNDGQFASFDLDPLIARVFNAVYVGSTFLLLPAPIFSHLSPTQHRSHRAELLPDPLQICSGSTPVCLPLRCPTENVWD